MRQHFNEGLFPGSYLITQSLEEDFEPYSYRCQKPKRIIESANDTNDVLLCRLDGGSKLGYGGNIKQETVIGWMPNDSQDFLLVYFSSGTMRMSECELGI